MGIILIAPTVLLYHTRKLGCISDNVLSRALLQASAIQHCLVKASFLLIENIIVVYVVANKKKGTSGLSLLIEMTDVTDLHDLIESLEGCECSPLLQIEVI